MVEMCSRFPGCIVVWITNPFDKVFLAVMASAVVEDLVDFEFVDIIDGGRFRRRDRDRAMVDRVRGLVWAENRYVKDWVYLEGFGEIEFVCDGGDLLDDLVGTNEPVLQLLGRSGGLRCKLNVC